MPTPFAVLRAFLTPAAMAAVEEAYTQAMLRELAEIARRIPHDDLAFQWDVAPEMMEWDAGSNAGGLLEEDGREGILTRLTRLSDAVPADVRHGYHFCYGDFDASQVGKPLAPAAMIDLYNSLAERVARPIDWVHMPVPAHADQCFFDRFADLHVRPETQIYLGLITAPRTATAQNVAWRWRPRPYPISALRRVAGSRGGARRRRSGHC